MNAIEKQRVLDVLNSLEVLDQLGGEDAYILVDSNEETLKKLNDVGVSRETIYKYGDENGFCILALAFNENYATGIENEKLIYQEDDFEKWVTESENKMFEFEKFKRIGKENDFVFQTLVFMGEASQKMSLAFSLTEQIQKFPKEIEKEFREISIKYSELQGKVRKLY